MRGCSHDTVGREILFSARDYVTQHPFAVARCCNCGLVVTDPQPSAHELGAYYPRSYYGTAGARRFPVMVEALQRALYSLRARAVERLAGSPGRVLDVGCGRGHLLEAFRRRGWEAHGTELSAAASSHAREVLRIPVHLGGIETWPWPDEHFDAVTLWHVLEHWRDPAAVVERVQRLLRPGGVLMVGVPNIASLEAQISRDGWFHLDVPRHLVHLSPEWLEECLQSAGFELKERSFFAPEYDAFSFVQSALNRAGLEQNVLYGLLRGGEAKLGRGAPPRMHVIASLVLAVPLGMIGVPATLLAGMVGQGSSFTMLAVKNGASLIVGRTTPGACAPGTG